MSKIYKKHNCKITFASCNQLPLYNYRVKEEYPMDGKWQIMDANYDFRVTSANPQKIFFEFAEGKWEKRYYYHKKSFKHQRYSHETILSSYVCHLKGILGVTPNLKWSVVRCTATYSNITKMCLSCVYEKLVIITYPRQCKLLNKRWELYVLKNFRINDNKYLNT